MDPKFLKLVQESGFVIESVTEDAVIGKCPSNECCLRVKLVRGLNVPRVDPDARRARHDIPVGDFDDLRVKLRDRRESLRLSIREVEEISGIAIDHLAKFEKDQPERVPNARAIFDWAQSLGFELVLRPSKFNALALRTISETRDKADRRARRFEVEARRRAK